MINLLISIIGFVVFIGFGIAFLNDHGYSLNKINAFFVEFSKKDNATTTREVNGNPVLRTGKNNKLYNVDVIGENRPATELGEDNEVHNSVFKSIEK